MAPTAALGHLCPARPFYPSAQPAAISPASSVRTWMSRSFFRQSGARGGVAHVSA